MPKSISLTKETLQRLIREERQKLNESLEMKMSHPSEAPKKIKEVPAKDMAKTAAYCISQYRQCSIQEAKLKKYLKNIQEAKKLLKQQLLNSLDK